DIDRGLPFEDEHFDVIVAASSIEQTPSPEKTVKELFRILKPGGRMRVFYEGLRMYLNGREQEAFLINLSNNHSANMIIFNRNINREEAVQYLLGFKLPPDEMRNYLKITNGSVDISGVSDATLNSLKQNLSYAKKCITKHPSSSSWIDIFKLTGFREIIPSNEGRLFAGRLFDHSEYRPGNMAALVKYLLPIIKTALSFEISLDSDPMLTVIK
ncbi:MAG TPA: class I SAM-dependent methyltransferase, partial [Firmicutes bacterium]|nr:class I SAM-dependent methyltransferase [Bacillota bacterium]